MRVAERKTPVAPKAAGVFLLKAMNSRHPTSSPTRHALVGILLFTAACGGGGGGDGGGTDPQPQNTAPQIQVPQGLSGIAPRLTWVLPATGTATATFTATDADGDPLFWQVAGSGAEMAAAGVLAPSSAAGPSIDIDLLVVGAAAAVTFDVLVQDGVATASLEVTVQRAAAPTILGVSPSSAFSGQPTDVSVTGSNLTLAGSAQAEVRFGGALATNIVAQQDGSLACRTPSIGAAGPSVVAVSNAEGSSQLPSSAFLMMPYPPQLAATDLRVDAGAVGLATQIELASEDDFIDVAFVAGGAYHCRSADGGATYSVPTLLSSGEAVSGICVVAQGSLVRVAWIGDTQQSWVARSSDGGTTFLPATRVDAGGQPVSGLRLCADGQRVHLAWLSGSVGLNQSRVVLASSADGGATFAVPLGVSSGTQNQHAVEVGCRGALLCVAWLDDRQGSAFRGVYAARSADGGVAFSAAQRLSVQNDRATELGFATHGAVADVAFVTLLYGVWHNRSVDMGLTWRLPETQVRGMEDGVPTTPRVHAHGDRVYVAWITDGLAVRLARSSDGGATFPARTRLDSALAPVSGLELDGAGDYVTAAWLSGDASASAVRAAVATSADRGGAWRPEQGGGDGADNQGGLRMRQSGARIALGFLERRTLATGAYVNANQP